VTAGHLVWKNNIYGTINQKTFSTNPLNLNLFNSGVCINPHYAKRHKGGEDAACVNDRLLAVADGVGGWAESGVDPAIYSKKLCVLIDELWEEGDDRYLASPKELLIDACKSNTEIGSCTICMVSLDENSPVIFTANLGDSGYMILRNDKTVRDDDLNIFYESKE